MTFCFILKQKRYYSIFLADAVLINPHPNANLWEPLILLRKGTESYTVTESTMVLRTN